jgi:hypothetical protein
MDAYEDKTIITEEAPEAEEKREFPGWLKWAGLGVLVLILLLAALEAYHYLRPLPDGLSYRGELRPAADVRFLSDVTYVDGSANRYVRQEIFDEVFSMIEAAEKLLVIDMFLFNDFQGKMPETTRALSSELVSVLVKKMARSPRLRAVLITDPINTVYGGIRSGHLEALRAAGVEVVETRLKPLRDSNPIYSALWRPTFGLLHNTENGGWLKNPFGQGKVTLRSWLSLLNFKANHRKVILADDPLAPGGWSALVTSANPHDASSAHGNIAVRFSGPAVADLLETEQAVLRFSGGREINIQINPREVQASTSVAVLTESAIEEAILESIYMAREGDRLMVSVFYLSDRDIVWALKEARGARVNVRVLLDPNFNAFGHDKNGIPNRQVGAELTGYDVSVRWCDTHGEQCHAKMLLADYADGTSRLIAGSANFTRRNLDDLNLETDVLVEGPSGERVFSEARGYFALVWDNRPGRSFSVSYEEYAEDSILRDYMYRFQEFTGLSTF